LRRLVVAARFLQVPQLVERLALDGTIVQGSGPGSEARGQARRLAKLPGEKESPDTGQLLADLASLRADGRIHRGTGYAQGAPAGPSLEARETFGRLACLFDHLLVRAREQVGERLQLVPAVFETLHAQVEQLVRLLAPDAGRFARLGVHRHPLACVGVEGFA